MKNTVTPKLSSIVTKEKLRENDESDIVGHLYFDNTKIRTIPSQRILMLSFMSQEYKYQIMYRMTQEQVRQSTAVLKWVGGVFFILMFLGQD